MMKPLFCACLPLPAAAMLAISVAYGSPSTGRPISDAADSVPLKRIVSMAKPGSRDLAQADRSTPLPLPRDPNVAVREEFELARARGTAEAWQLFISRHGDHQLAAEARKQLEQLKNKR